MIPLAVWPIAAIPCPHYQEVGLTVVPPLAYCLAIADNRNNIQVVSARQGQEVVYSNPHTGKTGSNELDAGHRSSPAARPKEADHRSFALRDAIVRNKAGTKLLLIGSVL